jgi:hypothetical protein
MGQVDMIDDITPVPCTIQNQSFLQYILIFYYFPIFQFPNSETTNFPKKSKASRTTPTASKIFQDIDLFLIHSIFNKNKIF